MFDDYPTDPSIANKSKPLAGPSSFPLSRFCSSPYLRTWAAERVRSLSKERRCVVSDPIPESAPAPLPLPDNPNLDWLRNEAKRRLEEVRRTNPAAKLTEAQFELARRGPARGFLRDGRSRSACDGEDRRDGDGGIRER
jgi:hypothetical protein